MEIRLIKRAYCLWCHGYPVITHSVAAPPPFALKPRRDSLPPKSNQLSPPPSTFTSDIVPDRLHTSLSTSRDGEGRGVFERRLRSGVWGVNFTRRLISSFSVETFLPVCCCRFLHIHVQIWVIKTNKEPQSDRIREFNLWNRERAFSLF